MSPVEKCPKCGSTDVIEIGYARHSDGGYVATKRWCWACEAEWKPTEAQTGAK